MKKEPGLTSGTSEPEMVDAYMKKLKYPLKDVVQYLREFILSCDPKVGESIAWNAPAFYYTGKMKPFNPKDYKRYIVGFNLFKQDALRLIFLRGADVDDPKGLLEGDYKDGRRLMTLKSMDEVKANEKELKKIVKQLITGMN
jgi:hypothetical protein